MSGVEAVSGVGEVFSSETQQEESLKIAIENLSDYLFRSNTGWKEDYGAYLVLKVIFSNIKDPNVTTAFNTLEHKVEGFLQKHFYLVWDHYDFNELLDTLGSSNPTIHRAELKGALISCLKALFPEIDEACSGTINNQASLSLIYGKLTTIGFILRDTQQSIPLRKKGQEIVSAWFFPRFGNSVAPGLKLEVEEILDLLKNRE